MSFERTMTAEMMGRFWVYVIVAVVLATAPFCVGFGSALAGAQKLAADHGDQTAAIEGIARHSVVLYGGALTADFAVVPSWTGMAVVVAMIFVAAALTRHLLDNGPPGWRALLSLGLAMAGFALMRRLFDAVTGTPRQPR